MEHYDWNEGWLFAPTFDPALVRPECPELSLTPVRLPHTVKPLPYNCLLYTSDAADDLLCGVSQSIFSHTAPLVKMISEPRNAAGVPGLHFYGRFCTIFAPRLLVNLPPAASAHYKISAVPAQKGRECFFRS